MSYHSRAPLILQKCAFSHVGALDDDATVTNSGAAVEFAAHSCLLLILLLLLLLPLLLLLRFVVSVMHERSGFKPRIYYAMRGLK